MSTPTTIIEVQPPPIIVVESVGGEFIGPQGPPGPEGPPGSGGGGSLTSTVTPAALAASAAIGSSNEGARADHAHARPTLGELGAEAAGTAGATMAVHTGAAHARKPAKVWLSGAWVIKPAKRWTGALWSTT
jgi:hypothetical protein